MDGPPLSARPETPVLAGLFGDEKASTGVTPGAGDAQPTDAPARRSITVPAAGLCEKLLREALGPAAAELNSHIGDDLGCPRDYGWPRGGQGHVFTLAGVRRVIALLCLPIDVLAEGETPPPVPATTPAGQKPHARGPWWQRDLSED